MESENLEESNAQNITKHTANTESNGDTNNHQNLIANVGVNMNSGDGIVSIQKIPAAQNSKGIRPRKRRYYERVRPALYRESKSKAKQLIRNIAKGIVVKEVKPTVSIRKSTRSQFLFPRRMNSKSTYSFTSDTGCSRCGCSCCYRFN